MKEIILASSSPRRFELLKQIGLDFRAVAADVDERLEEHPEPYGLTEKLAYLKALAVAKQVKTDALIIGADTIVVKDSIMGKPKDSSEAFSMLKSLQGDWHEVVTGMALIDSTSLSSIKGFEKTRVKMRELTDSEIESYIKTKEPLDKAGAYGIQGMGAVLVERIEGCYFNVVGLPLTKLSFMLKSYGVNVI